MEMSQISKTNPKQKDIRPSEIKKIVNKYMPIFAGNEQHDAQEFLSFFLDKLSEDLHREMHEEDQERVELLDKEIKDSTKNQTVEDSPKAITLEPAAAAADPSDATIPTIVVKKEDEEVVGDGGTGGDFSTPAKVKATEEETVEGGGVGDTLKSDRKNVSFRTSAYS